VGAPPSSVSVIIPTFNGAARIGRCLAALRKQTFNREVETIVVNDGSLDQTSRLLMHEPGLRVFTQDNAGPAAARNHGAREASGEIIVFTDDDCEPVHDWLSEMLKPFDDPDVVASKGTYRTRQSSLIARFVQIEYEDRYRIMAKEPMIDFIDTYSAAFRRDRFLEMGGYDVNFPIACAEDIELSYRMSSRGWKMIFAPAAAVYHQHPDNLVRYVKKKFKFAFWRVLAVRRNPAKAVKDSHTPQLMKMQMLCLPLIALAAVCDITRLISLPLFAMACAVFVLSTLPFSLRALNRDLLVGIISPFILFVRSSAQLSGVISGLLYFMILPTTKRLAQAFGMK
jgi:GT2 family glycosyltransferase